MLATRSCMRRPIAAALFFLPLLAPAARADEACRAAPSQDCVFAWALATARAERLETSMRIGTITNVASGRARAGRGAEAAAAFREALVLGDALRPHWAVDQSFAIVAGEQVKAGLIEEGLAVARGIAGAEARAKAFAEIAKAMVARGRLEDGLAVARAIEHPETRSATLEYVGRALAAAGRPDDALGIARSIAEARPRLRVLYKVADAMARGRKPEADALLREGIALARTLAGEADQAIFVGQFAGVLAWMGRDDEAMALADSIAKPELRHSVHGPIASGQAEAGRIDAALATLKLISTRRTDFNNPVFARTAAMRDIVLAMAKAGRMDEANALALTMGNVNDYRYVAFRGIALAHAKAGRFEEAMALARSRTFVRDYVFRGLIPVLTEAGRFDDALALSRALAQAYEQAPAIAVVGAGLLKAERKPAAEAAFREALTVAAALPEGFFRSEALVKIALLLPR